MSAGRLVAIMGTKRAGKDEVAKILMAAYPDIVRAAFADVMKDMAYAMDPIMEVPYEYKVFHGIPDRVLGEVRVDACRAWAYIRLSALVDHLGWDKAKEVTDVRRFLQRLGTEGGRDCLGQDVWVDACFDNTVIPSLNDGETIVVTDARFRNEIRRVREVGGELWRVDRPGLAVDLSSTGTHTSEVEWRKERPDRTILNDGDLEDLRWNVLMAFEGKIG